MISCTPVKEVWSGSGRKHTGAPLGFSMGLVVQHDLQVGVLELRGQLHKALKIFPRPNT